jgi:hypothetical protein
MLAWLEYEARPAQTSLLMHGSCLVPCISEAWFTLLVIELVILICCSIYHIFASWKNVEAKY